MCYNLFILAVICVAWGVELFFFAAEVNQTQGSLWIGCSQRPPTVTRNAPISQPTPFLLKLSYTLAPGQDIMATMDIRHRQYAVDAPIPIDQQQQLVLFFP